MKLLLVQMLRR